MSKSGVSLGIGIAILSGAALIAQSPPQSAQPSTQATAQPLTINGCVYRASDDTTVFALERTTDADSTGTQPSGVDPAGQANVRGAVGTGGTTTASPGGAAIVATGEEPMPWYRLSKTGNPDLANFVGRSVRITGTIPAASPTGTSGTSAAAAKSAPISNTRFTTAELGAAPQLVVTDITAVEGQCKTANAVPQNQPQR